MITLKQLKNKLQKDFGWKNLESHDNKWLVDNLLKDTIKAIEVTPSFKKNRLDLLNWAKSELSKETNTKLSKTMATYRSEKIIFLRKIVSLLNNIKL